MALGTHRRIANERFNAEPKLQQQILGGIDDYRLLLPQCWRAIRRTSGYRAHQMEPVHQFVAAGRAFSGIQGIGYAAVFGMETRALTSSACVPTACPSSLSIRQAERYCAVTYLEPYSRRSDRTFGYDMCSEPTRRLAMEIGRSVFPGKVGLMQEGGKEAQPGFPDQLFPLPAQSAAQ